MNICIITGSRADWGLLKCVAAVIDASPDLTLNVIATGQHLCEKFGNTEEYIEYPHMRANAVPRNNTRRGITEAMGEGFKRFSKIWRYYKPDCVVVLGDRWEIVAPVITAYTYRIPIAHIHGGESTYNSYDDAFRHAITKFSSIHFASHKFYASRIKMMGESPLVVFTPGALGVERLTPVKVKGSHILVVVHPATLSDEDYTPLFSYLSGRKEKKFLIQGNLDATTDRFRNAVMNFVCSKKVEYIVSLKREDFIGLLSTAKVIVGNSSAGVIEAPSVYTPTINVGDRQKGRVKAASVIDCGTGLIHIEEAFNKLKSREFRDTMKHYKPKFNGKGVAKKIVDTIVAEVPSVNLKKEFYDVLSG